MCHIGERFVKGSLLIADAPSQRIKAHALAARRTRRQDQDVHHRYNLADPIQYGRDDVDSRVRPACKVDLQQARGEPKDDQGRIDQGLPDRD